MSALRAGGRSDGGAAPRSERDEFVFELGELLSMARRRGRWIALSAALCAGAAGLAGALREPVYASTAQVMLDPRGLNLLGDQVVPPSPSSDVNDAVIETEVRLLSSDEVMRAAAQAAGLADGASARPGLAARALSALGLRAAPAAPADPLGAAAAALRRRVSVAREGKSFVVDVSAKASTPGEAARLAKATVDSFLAALVAERRNLVARAQAAMEATLGGQRERLARAEDAVERYKRAAGIVDADGRTLNLASVTQLDAQILTARAATAAQAAKLAQIDAIRRSPGQPSDVESPLLTQLRTSRAEVARQQANLQATLGPRHPQIQEVGAQLKALDRAVGAEIDRLAAATRSAYEADLGRERSLQTDRDRLEGRVADSNAALVEMRQLEREADAQRAVYGKVLGRERDLREQESVSPVNASLLAEPTAADAPSGVKPGLLAAAGAALGLLLGAALAWGFERWTGRVYSAGRLGARAGLPVLGTVAAARAPLDGMPAVGCALAEGRGTPTSRAIERLADALDRGPGPSSLIVLSASGGAGALVASGAALALAALGRRTLLVQAAAPGDPVRLASAFALPPGVPAPCEVDGFPAFAVERLGPRAALGERRADWAARYERAVFDLGPEAGDAAVRGLAAGATLAAVVVEAGSTSFAEVDAMLDLVSGAAEVGLLFASPGRDPVRVLPARAAAPAASAAPRVARALRASHG